MPPVLARVIAEAGRLVADQDVAREREVAGPAQTLPWTIAITAPGNSWILRRRE